jgi:cobalt-precorrin 5A hydrolase
LSAEPMRIAIIAITGNGARLGSRLQAGLAHAELYVPAKHCGKAVKSAIPVQGELHELVTSLWHEVAGFVFIMATGIVVRLLAPLLDNKAVDPGVVVMDDAGKFAISLLSGHLGGGNELAERAAFITGARAVITTATDVNGLPSFDMLAKDNGWAIENLSRVKKLNALLLENEKIAVVDETSLVRAYFHGRGNLQFFDSFIAARRSGAPGVLFVTSSIVPPQLDSDALLVLRPKSLFLGIGCNSGTTAEEIHEVILSNCKRLLLSPASIAALASAEAKESEPGLLAAAAAMKLPLRFFSSTELNSVATPTPPSEHALAAIGAQGVAEPAAILSSGGGKLLLKKVKSGNVTLAIAEKR